ncbi:DUF7281 domain-containing protein [Halomonas denitrificans]|uniref:DUF7281 domain-containing protein n=1 Tax=Halomonas denitrificans TaxID=370769 RepID=UPI000D38F5EE|nr:DUF2399 domain-containing protein [Halomonas denitrificans]
MRDTIKALQRVLRQPTDQVRLGQVWRHIHEEHGIGTPQGRTLRLLAHDLDRIRRVYDRLTNNAGLHVNLDQDRVSLAGHLPDEKISTHQAFSTLQRVAHTKGEMTIRAGDTALPLPCPPGVLLAVLGDMLILPPETQNVLVVENGAVMERWWQIVPLLPDALRHNTLILYRGHDQGARELKTLLADWADRISLHLFVDFDAAGLEIAQGVFADVPARQQQVVIPVFPLELKKSRKEGEYFKQLEQLARLERQHGLSAELRQAVQLMKQERLALSQEAMLAHGAPVTSIAYRAGNHHPA